MGFVELGEETPKLQCMMRKTTRGLAWSEADGKATVVELHTVAMPPSAASSSAGTTKL